MPETKRQKLIDAVLARMQTIRTANGYETDLGSNVDDWRVNWDSKELPALSVLDTVAEVAFLNDQPTAARQMCTLPVMLRIYGKSDSRAADLRKMLADVVRAIGTDPYWTSEGVRLALWTRVTREGIVNDPESFEIGGAAVEIEIAYLQNSFDTYQ